VKVVPVVVLMPIIGALSDAFEKALRDARIPEAQADAIIEQVGAAFYKAGQDVAEGELEAATPAEYVTRYASRTGEN
jgi:hypothetical protein